MPTLEWIGKDKVVNHHQEVPFRVLEHRYTYTGGGQNGAETPGGNMIIKGDNLEALKALLPQYEGRIKCIYIDPPYNTGNEGWVYNDNVNDPKIKKWLGEVVGREGEDLSRHDKWLCMIYPRLKLLQKLLADDGAIFISIDDAELQNLYHVCDEIFGSACFVSNVSWQRTYSTRNDSKGIVNEVEHILVYSKQPAWSPNKLPRTVEMNAIYKNPDKDVKSWTSDNPFAPGAATHQGMVYAIQHPFTGKMLYPSNGACWRYQQDDMLEIMRGWCNYELKDLHDEHERAEICGVTEDEVRKGVMGIVLSDSLEIASAQAQKVYERGQWPRFFFTRAGKGGIRRKTYLENVGGRLPTNLWPYVEVGHTDEAKKQVLAIFNGRATFNTPKPSRLIERILQIATDPDSIILDSFAGSGTTAHAVLKMNKINGGNRRFILVEMMDYAETITAERVRRVIDGYSTVVNIDEVLFDEEITPASLINGREMLEDANAIIQEARETYDKVSKPKVIENHLYVIGTKKVTETTEGVGGGFSFYELGEPMLLLNGNINEKIDVAKIRAYIFYMETKHPMPTYESGDNPSFLGKVGETAYYFHYNKESATTLDATFLSTVGTKAEAYVIYADQCVLSPEYLQRRGIVFRKIPRDIQKL